MPYIGLCKVIIGIVYISVPVIGLKMFFEWRGSYNERKRQKDRILFARWSVYGSSWSRKK